MKELLAIAAAMTIGAAVVHAQDEVYRAGGGVAEPQLVKSVAPQYTAEAMRHKIAGAAVLEAVVKPDGTVSDVTVIKSLDREYGLDDSCVRALKQWTFKPGTKDGKAVAVRVDVTMTFTMN
jgi:periplasmic protein TonB